MIGFIKNLRKSEFKVLINFFREWKEFCIFDEVSLRLIRRVGEK